MQDDESRVAVLELLICFHLYFKEFLVTKNYSYLFPRLLFSRGGNFVRVFLFLSSFYPYESDLAFW